MKKFDKIYNDVILENVNNIEDKIRKMIPSSFESIDIQNNRLTITDYGKAYGDGYTKYCSLVHGVVNDSNMYEYSDYAKLGKILYNKFKFPIINIIIERD